MKKRIFILIIFLLSFNLINADMTSVTPTDSDVSVSDEISLSSIISTDDLSQINENINYLKNNYGITVKFIIVDSSNSPTGESLSIFQTSNLAKGQKNWNTLVLYNKKQNELKFVTYRKCNESYDYLSQLKQKNFIGNVLSEQNPSDSEISNMFLQISEEFKNLVQSVNLNKICEEKIERSFKLQEYEYPISRDALRAYYAIVTDTTWEKSQLVQGAYIRKNYLEGNFFDFLPGVDSPKKRFINLLKQHSSVSDRNIKLFCDALSRPGNIVLSEIEYPIIFHERAHKIITEKLTSEEKKTLISAREDFLNTFKAQITSSSDVSFPLFSAYRSLIIINGSWQELYAYLAEYQKYPSVMIPEEYIDDSVYSLLSSRYPDAYKIYQKVYNLASD